MIKNDVDITPGMIVKHGQPGGMRYEVEDSRLNATGWEKTQATNGKVINYTQIEDGKYPAGTKWAREEQDFRQNFSLDVPQIN